jgi:hypothetical protein
MDDDDNEHEEMTDIFISLSMEVKLIRFIGNTLVPSYLHMSIALERDPDAEDAKIELALQKWRYWMDNIVSKSIVFSKDNDAAMEMLLDEDGVNRTGNLFLLAPDEPSDELVASLLQAKLNALANGALTAITMEITSDNLHGMSFTILGDHSIYMPQTSEEFVGGETFWDRPWWHRDDASSIDVLRPSPDAKMPGWAYSLDFLDRQSGQKGTVINRPSFNPTIIDGGKPDEPK